MTCSLKIAFPEKISSTLSNIFSLANKDNLSDKLSKFSLSKISSDKN